MTIWATRLAACREAFVVFFKDFATVVNLIIPLTICKELLYFGYIEERDSIIATHQILTSISHFDSILEKINEIFIADNFSETLGFQICGSTILKRLIF